MFKIVDGEHIPLTEEEIQIELDKEVAFLAKIQEEAANAYIEQRKNAYPSIEDQLDVMYHQGFDAWKALIATIKAAYPKPVN